MKLKALFIDRWSKKEYEEICESLETLQAYMTRYYNSDCVCISLKVIK